MTVLTMHPPQMEVFCQDDSFSSQCSSSSNNNNIANNNNNNNAIVNAMQQQQQHVLNGMLETPDLLEEINLDDDDDDESNSSSIMDAYKTVRFSIAPTTVIDYLHRNDMTPNEHADTWMTVADLMDAKRDMVYTKELAQFQGDNLEFTKRGLEPRLRNAVRTCRYTVMQEQYRQAITYGCAASEELLASKYAAENSKAVLIATARGLKDAAEVVNMYSPERLAKEEREGYGFYCCASFVVSKATEVSSVEEEEAISSDDDGDDCVDQSSNV